jgi:hypothetical protein
VGLLAAIAFMIGLASLIGWYELFNVPLVAGALALLARDDDRSLLDGVRDAGRAVAGEGLPAVGPYSPVPAPLGHEARVEAAVLQRLVRAR